MCTRTRFRESARFTELSTASPGYPTAVFHRIVFVVAFVLRRTNFGFGPSRAGQPACRALRGSACTGSSPRDVSSGGFAAGRASESLGQHFFQPTFAYIGFDGIAIALLARANPIAILPAAFLWGSLLKGAPLMQQEADVSIDVVRIIQSMVLLFVAADAIVRYLFRLKAASGPHIDAPATGWSST